MGILPALCPGDSLFLLVLGRPPRLAPLGETLFLALSGVALFNLAFFTGVRLAPASDASAVAALYPLSTAFAYSLYFRKPLWDPLESTCRHASLSIL